MTCKNIISSINYHKIINVVIMFICKLHDCIVHKCIV